MTRKRFLASVLAVALAAVSIGAATAWLSVSATLQYGISAASDFGNGDHEGRVWVCKLAGPPHDPWVKPGRNPILVPLDNRHALNGFSDAHPSYIVANGDVECEKPAKADIRSPGVEEGESESRHIGAEPEETPDSTTPTSTTTTTTSATSSTTSGTSTTTTTTIPATTTTAPNRDEPTGSVTTTTSTTSPTTVGSSVTEEQSP